MKFSVVRLQRSKIALSLSLATLAFLGAGCATAPVPQDVPGFKTSVQDFGQWRGSGKATRTIATPNGSRVEKYSINVEVVSRTPGYGRIEVTGAMGVYGGTVAWNPSETRILLPTQKKFVIAETKPNAFRQLLPIDLSPRWLESVLFRSEINSGELHKAGYLCRFEKTKEALKEICEVGKRRYLERAYYSDGRTLLTVKLTENGSQVGALELELSEIRSKVQERPELWKLEPPKGFQLQRQFDSSSPNSRL